ncbi:hypothetical protein PVAP13_6KG030700 [Panicum virgatum]|nr:hypothetical protein PVAP13_6KG030700 [Panicum virgatum]
MSHLFFLLFPLLFSLFSPPLFILLTAATRPRALQTPGLPPDPRLPLPPDSGMSPPPVPPWSRHPAVGRGLPPPRLPLRQHPRSDFPQCPNPRRPKALRPAAPPRSDFPRPADQEGRRSLLDGRCPHPARRHRPLQEQTRYDARDITAVCFAQDPTVRLLDGQGR